VVFEGICNATACMPETVLTHRCPLCGDSYNDPDRELCDCGYGLVEYTVTIASEDS